MEAHKFLKKSISLQENEIQEYKNLNKLLNLYAQNLQNLGYIDESEMCLRKSLKNAIMFNKYKSLNTVECLMEYSLFFNYIEENKETYIHLKKANKILNKVKKRETRREIFSKNGLKLSFFKNSNSNMKDYKNLQNTVKILNVKVNYLQILTAGQGQFGNFKLLVVINYDCETILKQLKISINDNVDIICEQIRELTNNINIPYIFSFKNPKIELELIKAISNYLSVKALDLQLKGQNKKAEDLNKKGVDIVIKLLGENHKLLINLYTNLLNYYYDKNDEKNLKVYIEKIIKLSKDLYGELHIEYAITLISVVKMIINYHYTDYSLNLLKQGELIMNSRLEELKKEENEKDNFINLHIYTAEIQYLYGFLNKDKDIEKSIHHLDRSILIYENILGSTSECYLKAFILKAEIVERNRINKAKKEAHNQK